MAEGDPSKNPLAYYGAGLHRDPRYPGKFGIPDFLINTPQTVPQWWLVVFLLGFVILPFGWWGAVEDGGGAAFGGYFALVGITAATAWMIRNEISQDVPQMLFSTALGWASLGAYVYIAAIHMFPEGQWVACTIACFAALFSLNIIYRSWQHLLAIGLWTVQKREVVPPSA